MAMFRRYPASCDGKTTIVNRCQLFREFVSEHIRFSTDKKSIEVVPGPRKGWAAVWSRCHLPAPRLRLSRGTTS